ncbi:hypothetical protein B7494_g1858 [Chlorociboria aeruginascens]|nr:hypothetical protein B7494_g1858 [Chlorociboria aeruginascens]
MADDSNEPPYKGLENQFGNMQLLQSLESSEASTLPDISRSYTECLELYRHFLKLLSREPRRVVRPEEVDVTKALEEYGKLRTWGEETRAALPADARGSLDDVLRKDATLKDAAIRILTKLQRQVQFAIQIAETPYDETAEPQERPTQNTSSGEDTESSSGEEENDIDSRTIGLPKISSIIRYMAEDIRSLYQISLLLSRPGFSRRYLHSTGKNEYDPRVACYAGFDLQHIKEKVYQWNKEQRGQANYDMSKDKDILTRRLAKANTKRREQLLYWSRHPDVHPEATTGVGNAFPILAADNMLDSGHDRAQSVSQPPANTRLDTESQGPKSATTKMSFSTVAASDIFDTQTKVGPARTIYAESTVGNRRSNRVPEIPKVARENPSFMCPYCHITLDSERMQTRLQWKRHVFRDLRPYLCTFKDCEIPDKQYLTRHDWIYHENQMHRRLWICETHGKAKFPTKPLFIQHVSRFHSDSHTRYQVPVLTEMSERQIDEMSIVPCPLCPDELRLITLQSHLAEHLESIALFVLPAAVDQDDDNKSADAAGGETSSRMLESDNSEENAAFPETQNHDGWTLMILEGHTVKVSSVAFSPDGKLVVSASGDDTTRIWDTATGALQQTFASHLDSVNSVAFSPNGELVISASSDSTVKIWNAAIGALQQTIEGHSGSVNSVAFSPNGKLVVSASDDKTVRLWDAATGAALQMLEGHSDSVNSVAFSPDGKQIVSGSRDETVRLWNAATGAPLQTLEGHLDSVSSVAFSPDGKQVVSGSWDKTVRIWGAAIGALQQKQL